MLSSEEAVKVLVWLKKSLDIVSDKPDKLPQLITILQSGYYTKVLDAVKATMKGRFVKYADIVASMLAPGSKIETEKGKVEGEVIEPKGKYAMPVMDEKSMAMLVKERADWFYLMKEEERDKYVEGVMNYLVSLKAEGKDSDALTKAISYIASPEGIVVLHYLFDEKYLGVWSGILEDVIKMIYIFFAAILAYKKKGGDRK